MAAYLKLLGALFIAAGILGSIYCWQGVGSDEAYFKARRGLEKYPGNVLFVTEFRMAEPRHMLLVSGTFSAAPIGVVLGSLCIGVGLLLGKSR